MTLNIDGVAAHVEESGRGEPVLLLHGFGGSIESWLPLMRDLSETKRVIALDFPGMGKGSSGRPPEPWSVTEFALWTGKVIERLGIAPVDIVAHSFGGRVSLLMAAERPDLVRRMVLTGCAGLPPRRTIKGKVRSCAYKTMRLFAGLFGEEARRKLSRRFGSADYNSLDDELKKTFVRVVNQDLGHTLPRIQASTLLIWGDKDDATPLWMGQRMEREIPDAGLVVLEDAGHFAYLERYGEFLHIVRHYLK